MKPMREVTWYSIGLVGFLAGIVAVGVMSAMLGLLFEHGRLSPLGWCVLVGSGGLFLAIWIFLDRSIDPERRQYLELIQFTEWLRDPHGLDRSARSMAMCFREVLMEKGMKIRDPEASLPEMTIFLKENASRILNEPELCSQAAAYYGEILKEMLTGEWRIWRKAQYADAVIRVGKGRKRHDVSPGLLVIRAATLPDVSLEAILEHEIQEMCDEIGTSWDT